MIKASVFLILAFNVILGCRAEVNCNIDESLLKYTLNRIKRAKVVMTPYPHVHIKGIFRPDFYPCLLNKLPDGRADKSNSAFTRFKSERYVLKLYDRDGVQFQEGARHYNEATAKSVDTEFWSRFAELFATHELAKAWVDVLGATTSKRYNNTNNELKFTYRLDLNRDMSGYEIGPHTDTDFKWVTTLYYLPSTYRHANIGTAILSNKNGLLQKEGTKHMQMGPEWKIESRAPFVPNSVLAFAPCWHSWHSVPRMREKVMRDSIQGFILSSKKTTKHPCGA
mmetsp:Transcript_29925/g.41424  ORF Transcript_29925/g.41424 Transcript_29925/m.41424 type:complete len:281 (-) Transcript_29925:194-1036(-)|eukprot:CAMPEP_0196571296 /NCGR_PEP_ID=MMETSP1081-20130531/1475_1 /TAXON_ID=36882 /ORGANISM="Pyramimonas amylifera, Strain CCMP720" /LENGTH=280 /DNA_ID=CAMNT_0041888177 /DNA_START=220 /DNA_END=1062 /DNA_ORIENTATION=-